MKENSSQTAKLNEDDEFMKGSNQMKKEFPVISKERTGERIKQLMDAKGVTVRDLKEFLHLGSVQSIYSWCNGRNLPTLDNCYALSVLFEIGIDGIVRGNRDHDLDIEDQQGNCPSNIDLACQDNERRKRNTVIRLLRYSQEISKQNSK